jgi:hypothetical protein
LARLESGPPESHRRPSLGVATKRSATKRHKKHKNSFLS